MQDSDYTEGQRQAVEGRWTLRAAGHFTAVALDGPRVTENVPVVPCDDAAVERVADEVERLMTDKAVWNVREAAERLLRAAGEGGSGDA